MVTTFKVSGYAAKFGASSCDLGGFVERLAPGCFRAALGRSDVRALYNHNPNSLLGRTSAGTLRLTEDSVGLRMELDLPDTTTGREVAELIRRGDLRGQSFSFSTISDSWDMSGKTPVRTVTEVGTLFDVGPVTFPAYESTSIFGRSSPPPRPGRSTRREIRRDLDRARLRLLEAF